MIELSAFPLYFFFGLVSSQSESQQLWGSVDLTFSHVPCILFAVRLASEELT